MIDAVNPIACAHNSSYTKRPCENRSMRGGTSGTGNKADHQGRVQLHRIRRRQIVSNENHFFADFGKSACLSRRQTGEETAADITDVHSAFLHIVAAHALKQGSDLADNLGNGPRGGLQLLPDPCLHLRVKCRIIQQLPMSRKNAGLLFAYHFLGFLYQLIHLLGVLRFSFAKLMKLGMDCIRGVGNRIPFGAAMAANLLGRIVDICSCDPDTLRYTDSLNIQPIHQASPNLL
ncbi:hypothetical protein JCM10914_6148 [Paenibacillus sp. JCM 10914]|nr:hypothetical protein JCM10914_6148 [Paenibacillus sp. JCM 10914]